MQPPSIAEEMESIMTTHHHHLRFLQQTRNEDSTRSVDGSVAILIIVLILFCVLWVPNLLQRCRRNSQEEEERQQELNAEMIQNSIRRLMEEGVITPSNMNQCNNRNRKWLQDRREFIENALLTKHVVIVGNKNDENGTPTKTQLAAVRRARSDLILPERHDNKNEKDDDDASSISSDDDEEDDKYPCCGICLVDYQDGDEICWAANKSCNHVYHKACIAQWLLRHDECPFCRTHFLSFHDDDNDEAPPATNVSLHSFHSRGGNSHHSVLSRGRQILNYLTPQRSRHGPDPTDNTSQHSLGNNNNNNNNNNSTQLPSTMTQQRSNHPPNVSSELPLEVIQSTEAGTATVPSDSNETT